MSRRGSQAPFARSGSVFARRGSTFSRRGSACAFTAMLALSNALPLQQSQSSPGTCANDQVMQALNSNEPAAVNFCKDYMPWSAPAHTETTTATVTSAKKTVTSTVTAQPTFAYNVAADYVVTATTTVDCKGAPTPPAVATTTMAKAVGKPVPTGASSADAHIVPAADPDAEFDGEHIALAKREDSLPDFLVGYDAQQVSSACNCLSSSSYATSTVTHTATATADTYIQSVTMHAGNPVINTHYMGATKMALVTACAAPTGAA